VMMTQKCRGGGVVVMGGDGVVVMGGGGKQ
jgi:hypothetical protein